VTKLCEAGQGLPVGGTQFYSPIYDLGVNEAVLSYTLRFSNNFSFNKGGKLPGLYGGVGNTGGKIPNGQDGAGVAYAYLPTSERVGTTYGRGSFFFKPGVWHRLEQEQRVKLDTRGLDDGEIDIRFDGQSVLQQKGLRFRDISTLKINGILFSTFFGGSDSSWATLSDCYIDFADFSIHF
jgi:hypothetical protein